MTESANSPSDQHIVLLGRICELCYDGITCLDRVPFEAYYYENKEFEDATLGQHYSSICDRIYCLLDGINHGTIHYDHRKRNKKLERDLNACRTFLNNVIHNVQKIVNIDITSPIIIKETMTINGDECTVHSTIERELVECCNYMVHHLAFIRLILFSMGFALDDMLGIAPASVIYHRSKLAPQQLDELLEYNRRIHTPSTNHAPQPQTADV